MPRASAVPFGEDVTCPCCSRTLARKGAIQCPRCKTKAQIVGDFATDLVGDQLVIAFLWKPDGSQASSILIRKEIRYNWERAAGRPEGHYPVFFVYNHVDPSKTIPMCGCRVNKEPILDLEQAIAIARQHEDEATAGGEWIYVEDLEKNFDDIDRGQIEEHVRRRVKGVRTAEEAEQRVRSGFFPRPLVWVQERGPDRWGVLLQYGPGQDNIDIICER